MDTDRVRIIEEMTTDLLMEYSIDATNGYDIVLLANKMGFAVGNASLADNDDGFIAVDKKQRTLLGTPSNKVVGVNVKRDYYLKRFIVAHELGHYVLEGQDQPLYAHRDTQPKVRSKAEQEADYFAACLLMPREAFIRSYEKIRTIEKLSERIKILKDTFEAPVESIIRRFEELELKV